MKQGLLFLAFGILYAVYLILHLVFGVGLSALAKGKKLPVWPVWIPLANLYLLGKLADQAFDPAARKGKLRWLLPVSALPAIPVLALLPCLPGYFALVFATSIFAGAELGNFLGCLLWMAVFFSLPVLLVLGYLIGVNVALYRVYRAYAPEHLGSYFPISLIFPPAAPFFLCAIRNYSCAPTVGMDAPGPAGGFSDVPERF